MLYDQQILIIDKASARDILGLRDTVGAGKDAEEMSPVGMIRSQMAGIVSYSLDC